VTVSPGTGLAQVDHGQLYYEVAGEGPVVVFVHGGLGDSRMWEPQMPAFAERFTAVRFDARGFGRSSLPSHPYSMVDDLAALFDALGIERASVVAVSLGNKIELEFLLTYPDRVDAGVLAVAGVTGFTGWSPATRAAFDRAEQARQAGDLDTAAREDLDLWCSMGPDGAGWDLIQQMERDVVATPEEDESLYREPETPTIERLEEIRCPVLAITADRDVPEMRDIADLVVSRVPNARHVEIEGADHAVNLRQPEKFNRVVMEFLLHEVDPEPPSG